MYTTLVFMIGSLIGLNSNSFTNYLNAKVFVMDLSKELWPIDFFHFVVSLSADNLNSGMQQRRI